MKKLIALLFVVALLCSTAVGCGDKKSTAPTGAADTKPKDTPASKM